MAEIWGNEKYFIINNITIYLYTVFWMIYKYTTNIGVVILFYIFKVRSHLKSYWFRT